MSDLEAFFMGVLAAVIFMFILSGLYHVLSIRKLHRKTSRHLQEITDYLGNEWVIEQVGRERTIYPRRMLRQSADPSKQSEQEQIKKVMKDMGMEP